MACWCPRPRKAGRWAPAARLRETWLPVSSLRGSPRDGMVSFVATVRGRAFIIFARWLHRPDRTRGISSGHRIWYSTETAAEHVSTRHFGRKVPDTRTHGECACKSLERSLSCATCRRSRVSFITAPWHQATHTQERYTRPHGFATDEERRTVLEVVYHGANCELQETDAILVVNICRSRK